MLATVFGVLILLSMHVLLISSSHPCAAVVPKRSDRSGLVRLELDASGSIDVAAERSPLGKDESDGSGPTLADS